MNNNKNTIICFTMQYIHAHVYKNNMLLNTGEHFTYCLAEFQLKYLHSNVYTDIFSLTIKPLSGGAHTAHTSAPDLYWVYCSNLRLQIAIFSGQIGCFLWQSNLSIYPRWVFPSWENNQANGGDLGTVLSAASIVDKHYFCNYFFIT